MLNLTRAAGWWTKVDVSREAGVTAPTFEYYLGRGMLPKPTHTPGRGVRKYYSEAEARQIILTIRKAQGK